jgi:hypothetical protein
MIIATSHAPADTTQSPMSGPSTKVPVATAIKTTTIEQGKAAMPDGVRKSKTLAAEVKRGAGRRKTAVTKRASARPSTAKPKVTRKSLGQSVERKGEVAPTPAAKPVAVVERARGKANKIKVIRDSFTMPAAEYERIAVLREKCLAMGVAMKKSELLRAGLATLERLSAEDLKRIIVAVESIKTGRPTGKKKKGKGKASKKRHK